MRSPAIRLPIRGSCRASARLRGVPPLFQLPTCPPTVICFANATSPSRGEALVRGRLEGCAAKATSRPKNKEMYIPFGIHISFLFFSMLYLLAFFFLLTVAVVITAAADRVNRAAHRAKLLSSPEGTLVRTGISAFSV